MRTACTFLALAFVSCASGYFYIGETRPDSELLATHADYVYFQGDAPKVYHFNTCKENNVEIDRVEMMTHRGRTVEGRMVQGGVNHFHAVVEVRGDREANTEIKFWGRWRGKRETLKIDSCFFVFDQYYPCNRPIQNYD